MKRPKQLKARRSSESKALAKASFYVKIASFFAGAALLSSLILVVWAIIQGKAHLRPMNDTLLPLKNILGLTPFIAAVPGLIFGILALRQEVSSDKGKRLWTFAFVLMAISISYLLFFPAGYLHFRLWMAVGPVTAKSSAPSPDGKYTFTVYDIPVFKGPLRELWVTDNATGQQKMLAKIAADTPLPRSVHWSDDGKTIVIEYAARKIYRVDPVTGKELNGKTLPYDPAAEYRARLHHKNTRPTHKAKPDETKPGASEPASGAKTVPPSSSSGSATTQLPDQSKPKPAATPVPAPSGG